MLRSLSIPWQDWIKGYHGMLHLQAVKLLILILIRLLFLSPSWLLASDLEMRPRSRGLITTKGWTFFLVGSISTWAKPCSMYRQHHWQFIPSQLCSKACSQISGQLCCLSQLLPSPQAASPLSSHKTSVMYPVHSPPPLIAFWILTGGLIFERFRTTTHDCSPFLSRLGFFKEGQGLGSRRA